MGVYATSFYDVIVRNAICFPTHSAWTDSDNGRHATYADVKRDVDKLAGGLLQAGLEPGDRMGVLAKNSYHFFLLYGAAAATGAIVLPINWRLSEDEAGANLADGAPVFIFADDEFLPIIDRLHDQLPSVRRVFNLCDHGGPGASTFADLLIDKIPDLPTVAADSGFVIIHTAAVAGTPRGALLSHANVLAAGMLPRFYFKQEPGDAHLNLLPLFHVAGLFMAISTFQFGGHNINMARFDAPKALALIDTYRVSSMFDFAPILGALLEARQSGAHSLNSLQHVIGLDNPETITAYQDLTGGTFYAMYGQTETSCFTTFGPYNDCPGAAGRPVPVGRMAIVDDSDHELPAGETGEIVVRGPMVFRGYWNQPRETARAFRNDWHHTGDLGKMDAHGFLWFGGRKPEKELIKPGGENVYPAEVEQVLLAHPDIEEAVVIGVPDAKWKEAIKAICIARKGTAPDSQEIIEFVGQKIARFKKPKYVTVVDDLPRMAGGQPDRAKIKAIHGDVDQ